jgi:peptidoglycan/xylan/chitin deacetylase (PgdA/CDA1 family)
MTEPASSGVHVALTFDFDAYTNWIGSLGATSPSMISRGEFGAIGVHRILAILAEYQAQATFFIPGAVAISYPRLAVSIREAGHEIGHHGWVHENPAGLSLDEEIRVLERGLDALQTVLGIRPAGYRSPSWDNSPNTVKLLLERGFEYESSLMGSDYEPYWCRVGDCWSRSEPYGFGDPVPLVEMPVAWHLDDWPWFEYVPGHPQGLRTPSAVLEVWRGEFDYLYHQVGRGVLIVTMHPQTIGRGYRLKMLRDFLDHVSAHPGVRFSTCIDYVRTWRAGQTPGLPTDVG